MPVVQHKGTARWDITVHGRSAHTSRPELGVNAILGAMDLIRDLGVYQEELRSRYTNPLMTGPAITVSMIRGGRTRNAVPDECTISVDFRVTPGMHPLAARDALIDRVAGLGLELSHSDLQIMTPPLDTPVDHPFSLHVLEICRKIAGSQANLCGEPYGTDASWLSDRAPALVLGPGDISYAHAVDERVSLTEVVACAQIYREIMLTWAG
jgi:acetylornithine deacetylase